MSNSIWDWYKSNNPDRKLDSFINNLQYSNKQKEILLGSQALRKGDIVGCSTGLLIVVKTNPNRMPQILSAAIEMNRFCDLHYQSTKDESFHAAKLSIPALLETVEPLMAEYVDSPELITKSKLIISKYKRQLNDVNTPVSQKQAYNSFLSSYQKTLKQGTTSGSRADIKSYRRLSSKTIYDI